jgi:hypothetical protein
MNASIAARTQTILRCFIGVPPSALGLDRDLVAENKTRPERLEVLS